MIAIGILPGPKERKININAFLESFVARRLAISMEGRAPRGQLETQLYRAALRKASLDIRY